jgi:hypothetical protein
VASISQQQDAIELTTRLRLFLNSLTNFRLTNRQRWECDELLKLIAKYQQAVMREIQENTPDPY